MVQMSPNNSRPRRNSSLLKPQSSQLGVSQTSETIGTSLNDLFRNQSVKQIKVIKEKSDEEITIKQNQLRNLVGERYRDIIEAADCMDSIQQLCLASTNQFIEMTRLIDDYKNTQDSITLTGADSSLDINLLLKHFSQIVDWMLNCVNSGLYFYAAICFLAANNILKQLNMKHSHSIHVKIRELNQLKAKLIKNCKNIIANQTNNLSFIQCVCALLVCDNLTEMELENLILKERRIFMEKIKYNTLEEKLNAIELIFDIFYDTVFVINNLFKKSNEKLFINIFLEKLIEFNFTNSSFKIATLKKEEDCFDLLQNSIIIPILYKGSFSKIYEMYIKQVKVSNEAQPAEKIKEWIQDSLKLINNFVTRIINETDNIFDLIEIKKKVKEMAFSDTLKGIQNRFKIILEYCCGFSVDFDSERTVKKIWKENATNHYDMSLSWQELNSVCKQQKYEIIKKRFKELTFDMSISDNISFSNIGEEIWKTPMLDSNILFDRFLSNHKSSNKTDNIFLQSITIYGSTREVRRKVRKQVFESQIIPLCKEIFLLIQDLQNKEEHSELEELIMTEYFNFYNSITEIVKKFIQDPTQFNKATNSSFSDMDIKLYCGRIIQSVRKLFTDIFIELNVKFAMFSNDESFLTIIRKLKAQITNLKQKKKADASPYLNKYLEIEQIFESLYLEAFNEWIEQQTESFVSQVKSELLNTEQWKKSRKDSTFVSYNELNLPFKTSFSIYNAIYELSLAIYAVGDFNVDKNVIEKLSSKICTRVFGDYNEWINSLIEKSKKDNNSKGTEESIDSESQISLEEFICEDGFLQLLFDVKYLGYALLGGNQQAIEKLNLKSQLESNEQLYVKAVSLILSFIDPINWETYEKSFNSLVLQCVNRNNLFTCNLNKNSSIHGSSNNTSNNLQESPLMNNTTEQDNFVKLVKSEMINIPLLPIPKKDLKSYTLAASYNHLEFTEKDIQLNLSTSNNGTHSTSKTSLNDNTVFGSFVGSLQNLISNQEVEKETPSSTFAFNWF